MQDYANYAKWHVKGVVGLAVGLEDASALYLHYLGNTGDSKTFDMHEAYIEDTGMRNIIDYEITSAVFAADQLATSDGTWKITGEPHLNIEYPTTENWQKTVGGFQQWTSATITRSGEHVTMRATPWVWLNRSIPPAPTHAKSLGGWEILHPERIWPVITRRAIFRSLVSSLQLRSQGAQP